MEPVPAARLDWVRVEEAYLRLHPPALLLALSWVWELMLVSALERVWARCCSPLHRVPASAWNPVVSSGRESGREWLSVRAMARVSGSRSASA